MPIKTLRDERRLAGRERNQACLRRAQARSSRWYCFRRWRRRGRRRARRRPGTSRSCRDSTRDISITDATTDSAADVPLNTPDASGTCPTGQKACTSSAGTRCIATSACCVNADCPGTCQTCNPIRACVAAVSQDDPNGRCSGTCDTTGACRSKKGQTCQTVAAGCASGTTCSADGIAATPLARARAKPAISLATSVFVLASAVADLVDADDAKLAMEAALDRILDP